MSVIKGTSRNKSLEILSFTLCSLKQIEAEFEFVNSASKLAEGVSRDLDRDPLHGWTFFSCGYYPLRTVPAAVMGHYPGVTRLIGVGGLTVTPGQWNRSGVGNRLPSLGVNQSKVLL